jgi:alkylated DNA repair protein alkB homolog 6
MPHLDGNLFYPVIATISCSAHTVLEFQRSLDDQAENTDQDKLICKLLVEPRSLLVLKHEMYEKYLHSIAERTEDIIDNHFVNVDFEKYPLGSVLQREKRISLTIRHVPKTSKMKLKIKF